MIRLLLLCAVLGSFAKGQSQNSPPLQSGRHLEAPVPFLCRQRNIHERYNGKGYFFSWKEPALAGTEEDWLGGRNYCRKRCMDLVSLETQGENQFIKQQIVEGFYLIFFITFLNSFKK